MVLYVYNNVVINFNLIRGDDMEDTLLKFLEVSEAVDASVEETDLSNRPFEVIDGKLSIPGIGSLSKRAIKHISRSCGLPCSVIGELTQTTLNTTVKEQWVRRSFGTFRIGRNPMDKNEIVLIQPVAEPYLKYGELLTPITNSILTVKGNPVTDDVVTVTTQSGHINPEGEDLIIGQQIRMSAINTKPITSDFLAYREICKNGLIDEKMRERYTISTKNASATFLADVLDARAKACNDFSASVEVFVSAAMKKEVPDSSDLIMDDAEMTGDIPKRVIKEARILATKVKSGEESLKSSGISNLDSLWMYVNLFTLVCQHFTNHSVVEGAQRGAYTWASRKLQGSLI
jgi:hypothetical protein